MISPNYDRWITAGLLFTIGIVVIFGVYFQIEEQRRADLTSRLNVERIERGQHLFEANCRACHGSAGEGVVGIGPTINSKDFLEQAPDLLIFETIMLGRPNTAMPSWGINYGGPFTDEEIRDITALMRSWEPTAIRDAERVLVGSPMRGAVTYSRTCYACHGVDGEGTTIAPALNDLSKLSQFDDSWYSSVINEGRPSLGMPTWGKVLSSQQIADLVSFIRAWQDPVNNTVQSTAQLGGDAVRGSAIFEATCAVCHGSNGFGGEVGPRLNEPAIINTRNEDFYRQVIIEGRLEKGMPRWGQVITPATTNDLLALIAHWGSQPPSIAEVTSTTQPGVTEVAAAATPVTADTTSALAPANLDLALITRGEQVYLTAGGVGCIYCHGADARGDVGPNIRGKSKEAVLQAFGTVQMMEVVSFIPQTDIEAVATYLQSLAQADGTTTTTVAQPATPIPPVPTIAPTDIVSAAPANLDPALITRGEQVYLTAGGVGCIYCHGADARGDVGPNIRGKSKEAVLQAFGTVQMMEVVSFIPQTDIEAVATYLQSLAQADGTTATTSSQPEAIPSTPIPLAPTLAPAEVPTEAPTQSSAAALDPALITRGEQVYLTAGGVGCIYCHGADARGDVGPNIRGKSKEAVLQAFGTVQMMEVVSFIPQTDIEAVATYLQSLAEAGQ